MMAVWPNYLAWLSTAAARSGTSGRTGHGVATAFEAAEAATVQPAVVAVIVA